MVAPTPAFICLCGFAGHLDPRALRAAARSRARDARNVAVIDTTPVPVVSDTSSDISVSSPSQRRAQRLARRIERREQQAQSSAAYLLARLTLVEEIEALGDEVPGRSPAPPC